jgi:hypothetical protein
MWCTHITIIVPSPWCQRQVCAVKNELIYVWVYYIKIYDPIKFSSNLWVFPGAINTGSHYERQVTSDRKNERNVSSYIIYTLFCWRYIYSYSFSLFFHPYSQIRIIIIIIIIIFITVITYIVFCVLFVSFLLKRVRSSSVATDLEPIMTQRQEWGDFLFFQLHLCVYA